MPSLANTIDINNPNTYNEWVYNKSSLVFDGTGDYLSCGDLANRLDSATELCIKAWIKIDDVDSEQIILFKGDADDHIVFKIGTGGDEGKLIFQSRTGGGTASVAKSDNVVNTGWEHVSVNFFGDGTENDDKLFMSINGGSNESVNFSGTAFGSALADGGANELLIGTDTSATFSGLMNELCIWGNPVDISGWSAVAYPLLSRAYLADSIDGFIRNFKVADYAKSYWMPSDIKLWLRFGDGPNDSTALIYNQRPGSGVASFNGVASGDPAFSTDVPGASD